MVKRSKIIESWNFPLDFHAPQGSIQIVDISIVRNPLPGYEFKVVKRRVEKKP